MIDTPQQAADYVAANWRATHDSFLELGPPPIGWCCAMTRLALVEIALEHELGVAGFGGMNHAEAAAVLIDLCRLGMERVGSATVQDLLADMGMEGSDADQGH